MPFSLQPWVFHVRFLTSPQKGWPINERGRGASLMLLGPVRAWALTHSSKREGTQLSSELTRLLNGNVKGWQTLLLMILVLRYSRAANSWPHENGFCQWNWGGCCSQRRKPGHLISILHPFHQGLLKNGILFLVILLILSKGRWFSPSTWGKAAVGWLQESISKKGSKHQWHADQSEGKPVRTQWWGWGWECRMLSKGEDSRSHLLRQGFGTGCLSPGACEQTTDLNQIPPVLPAFLCAWVFWAV